MAALPGRERLDAVIRCARTALCRVRPLRTYFGEDPGAPCGRCDSRLERPDVAAEVLRAQAESAGRPGL